MGMKFVGNGPRPDDHDLWLKVVCVGYETSHEAAAKYREWASGFSIGEPQATEVYSVEQLRGIGLVGLYVPDVELEIKDES